MLPGALSAGTGAAAVAELRRVSTSEPAVDGKSPAIPPAPTPVSVAAVPAAMAPASASPADAAAHMSSRARGACGCATRNDIWREAVGSERPRLRKIPYQIAKVPAAIAFRFPAVVYVPQHMRFAAVTGWRIYDGLQRGTWLWRWGPLVLNCTQTESGRGASMPGRRIAVQW